MKVQSLSKIWQPKRVGDETQNRLGHYLAQLFHISKDKRAEFIFRSHTRRAREICLQRLSAAGISPKYIVLSSIGVYFFCHR